jgi:signal transduction histidine kinase
LYLARGVWIAFVLAELVIILLTLLESLRYELTFCPWNATSCFVTPATAQALHQVGIAPSSYATFNLVLTLFTVLILLSVGGMLFWRKPSEPLCLAASFVFVTIGLWPFFTSSTYPPAVAFAHISATYILPLLGYFLVTFPDGRFVPRWSWLLVILWVMQTIVFQLPGPFNILSWPPPLFAAELLLTYGGTVGVQIYRYVRVSSYSQRQQTKWLVFGLAGSIVLVLLYNFIGSQFPGLGAPNSPYQLISATITSVYFMILPLSVGIAILRYRLWDIDRLINRTLVYGLLTASVIGLYVLIVGYFGALFRNPNNTVISLIATALVAIAFQPLRNFLQRGVNRLTYGERDAPYQVLAHLDQQLARALLPEEVLPALVKTIATTLKLPYVAVALVQSDASPLSEERLVASYGHATPHAQVSRLPLVYQGETVGQFVLAPRAGEEQLTRADRQLLEDLARHAGVIAHALRLTSDLRRSRERIVVAREEERRRLRRDLHDGLGPMLASLTLTLAAAREYLPRDPVTTDTLLQELATQVQGAVEDIRRLVYELRPPALDDLGLVGALRDQAARSTQGGLQVDVEAPQTVDPLPAAVEVAAYRIGLEALTNVVRHAQASNCTILVRRQADLMIEISDDGRGLPRDPPRGIGLRSMRERAEELGGNCVIATRPEGGTQVAVHLPLAEKGEGSNGAGD